jgi:hypothetical protein
MRVRGLLGLLAPIAVLAGTPLALAQSAGVVGHTKQQAERNLLQIAERSWKSERLPDLIDPSTYLLRDNVRAICEGRGQELHDCRFRLFRCVLEPWPAHGRQELYVTYRALANGRFRAHWLQLRMAR